jgi:importin subunit beta-1
VCHLRAFVAQLLTPHAPVILELVQKVLVDDNSGEPLDKLAFGVIGDLADAFPNGEIKPLLLAEWMATSLVSRKGYDKETKTTVKWAREVLPSSFPWPFRVNSLSTL